MAPKSLTPSAKQALILGYFHKSGVAHSIKDLEKALPSIASINGMQVKDYLQALSDDNKIRVEKIGSGNWYWSFPNDARKERESIMEKSRQERDKAASVVQEIKKTLDKEAAAREEDDDDMLLEDSRDKHSRAELMAQRSQLRDEFDGLKKELEGYRDNDPVEVEKRKQLVAELKAGAEAWTDQIQSMESWFKEQMAGDAEVLRNMKMQWYGMEFDAENECMKEL